MNTRMLALFISWFVIMMILLNGSFILISSPNTIENIIGFIIIAAFVILSIRTRCFTNIKINKNEK